MNRVLKTVAGLTLVVALSWLSGCSRNEEEPFNQLEQFNKEVAAIDGYLESNSISHIKDLSGIRIVPTSLGTKLPAQGLSDVNVAYKGSLFPSNTEFEQGTTTGALTGYIPGWQVAIRKLPVGSKATLYIPSYYGYGTQATGKIPANSTLIFDITVNSTANSVLYTEKFTSDTTAIRTYLNSKAITATKDETGVFYVNQVEGAGATPSWFDHVKIKYTFTILTDDSKPAGTYERDVVENFSSFVTDYPHGMQVGLLKMKPGSKMKLYVPSGLAFGIQNFGTGAGFIPANSNLIIDLELLEVK